MRYLLTRALWLIAAALFCALLGHAYFQNLIRLNPDSAELMVFIVSGLVPIAYLLQRKDPLPALVDNIWVGACGITLFALIDTVLRLGYLKHGLLTFLPIHLFTLHVFRVIEREGEISRQQSSLLLVLAIGALLLSALFNFG